MSLFFIKYQRYIMYICKLESSCLIVLFLFAHWLFRHRVDSWISDFFLDKVSDFCMTRRCEGKKRVGNNLFCANKGKDLYIRPVLTLFRWEPRK